VDLVEELIGVLQRDVVGQPIQGIVTTGVHVECDAPAEDGVRFEVHGM
jgi:hypothetical protein